MHSAQHELEQQQSYQDVDAWVLSMPSSASMALLSR